MLEMDVWGVEGTVAVDDEGVRSWVCDSDELVMMDASDLFEVDSLMTRESDWLEWPSAGTDWAAARIPYIAFCVPVVMAEPD